MDEGLINLFGSNTTAVDILREMIDPKNIVIKSEVNMEKIRVLLKIKWFSEIKKDSNKNKPVMEIFQDQIIPYYLSLMCSLNRQSRKEVIDAIKDINDKFISNEPKGISNLTK
jgi:hypothetical protein